MCVILLNAWGKVHSYRNFYIAFDIILICFTADCFINKLKLRDSFKSYEIVSSIRPKWIATHLSM